MKSKIKILTVVGARPQFIKAAAVSRQISKSDILEEKVLHTGQHYDENMSEVFFREMEIPKPAFNLGVHSSLQGEMTAKMLEGIEKIIIAEKPDALLVFGDTNSTLAGSLAASKLNVKLIHIEAGLRSFNMRMPEEVNRIVTDRLSSLLFCPTETAIKNLKAEGFDNFTCKYFNSGDVMYDAALYYSSKHAGENENIIKEKYVLATVHRAENTDDPARLKSIIEALNKINGEIPVVLPLHPRTKKTVDAIGLKINCRVIEPVGYISMLNLLKNCSLVMTDSGGLQKEALFFSKYCVTLRDETEWTELVENNFNVLAGSNTNAIVNAAMKMLNMKGDFSKKLYGDGHASEIIVSAIEKFI